ncbi:unnamed protein product [Phaeothamnion confervicola]
MQSPRRNSESMAEPHTKTGGERLVDANRGEAATGLTDDAAKMLKDLKLRRRYRFLVLKIVNGAVAVETAGDPNGGLPELEAALPIADCRYAIYDHEFVTADGRKTNKLLFISWLPVNASAHAKMLLTASKVAVRRTLEGLFDVVAGDFSEVRAAVGADDGDDDDAGSDISF